MTLFEVLLVVGAFRAVADVMTDTLMGGGLCDASEWGIDMHGHS